MAESERLRVASFNIRRASDRRGSHLPELVAEVLERADADVVALQEVDSRLQAVDGSDQLRYLADRLEATAVAGRNIRYADQGWYGNALLTRLPLRATRLLDLSRPGAEPRGAIDVELEAPTGAPVRVVATHLGLRGGERREQVGRLLDQLQRHRCSPTVLVGDLNEWRPVNRTVRRLDRALGRSPRPRTFPAALPLLPLDRVWVDPAGALESVVVLRGPRVPRVSDHLPLVATVRLADHER